MVDATDNVGAGRVGMPTGRFCHSLDPKRRLTIPSVLRARMGEPKYVYVLPSLAGKRCLEVLTPEEFESRLTRLRQASLSDADAADFATYVGSVAETLDVDTQGRIRIRDRLLEFVEIEKDVVLVGALNRLQVWSPRHAPSEAEVFANFLQSAKRSPF